MIAALLMGFALAQDGEPVDVRKALGSGAVINWTQLTLEVAATGRGGPTLNTRAVEELARRDAHAAIQIGVRQVRVTDERSVGDLQAVPEFSGPLDARVSRWWAAETRYLSSGSVEVDARLSLVDLLKPFTLATARADPPEEAPQPRYTGMVVDARGTQLEPAWAPVLLSATGDVLYEGFVWEEAPVDVAPVVYVSDPAHPASTRAGEDPIFLRVDTAVGARMTLTPEDSQRFRTSLADARLLGEGKVVIVVDTP